MANGMRVVRPGAQTIVVDRGRFGFRHLGLAWCGAADRYAYDLANALVENPVNAPALEITFGGAEFAFEGPVIFALSGADCRATLDGAPISPNEPRHAHAGTLLRLGRPESGLRTMLAVHGGFDVPLALGSASTDLAAGIGGIEGRALRADDVLAIGRCERMKPTLVERARWDGTVRFHPGLEFSHLDDAAVRALFASEWHVGHESNRMGYRLHGVPLRHGLGEIASHAVFPGTIQLPPSGEPIVLLCDAQTTGGYPVIGCVIDEDLARVAQMRSGDRLRFTKATA